MICVYWWCSCCCNMPRPMTTWYNIIIPVFCAWWAISYTVKTLLARTGSRMWALVLSFAALPKGGHKGKKHPEVGSWGIHGDTNMKQDSTMGGSQRLGIAVLFLNSQPKVQRAGPSNEKRKPLLHTVKLDWAPFASFYGFELFTSPEDRLLKNLLNHVHKKGVWTSDSWHEVATKLQLVLVDN